MSGEKRKQYQKQWASLKRARIPEIIVESSNEEELSTCEKSSPNDESHSSELPETVRTSSVSDGLSEISSNNYSSVSESSSGVTSNTEGILEHAFRFEGTDAESVQSGCESSSDDYDQKDKFQSELRQWASMYFIKHDALSALLKILKDNGHSYLPVTARTLLKTRTNITVTHKSGMDYFYLGISEQLTNTVKRNPAVFTDMTIKLAFNIDGIPLFKSSSNSLWPILCSISNMEPSTVFPVALTVGKMKPNDLEFLDETIKEIDFLARNGIVIETNHYSVSIDHIVCDAPARAMVRCVKQYSGYYGCDRCTQRGEWNRKVTYPETNAPQRTDMSFRSQSNLQHHTGSSPFCALPINMISTFPLDYMHLVCLGVMRRMIKAWQEGPRSIKISANQFQQISDHHVQMRTMIPREFVRKPRSLREVDRWKATEFRMFLLYTGQFALKGVIRSPVFANFRLLSTAIRLLISPALANEHTVLAHQMLVDFVRGSVEHYGTGFLVYNVHGLIHLPEDVACFGSLDACSAFSFENYLQTIKRMVRSGYNTLTQIVGRLSEGVEKEKAVSAGKPNFKAPNNGFILHAKKTCEVLEKSAYRDDRGESLLLCKVSKRPEPMFTEPCDSRLTGIYMVVDRKTENELVPISDLLVKAVIIKQDGTSYFLTMLHKL